MGTNFTLPEIRKIAKYAVIAYKEWTGETMLPEYPDEELDHAIANILSELHLKALAAQLLRETKVVRGD